jgi:glutamate synthase (NADPH/NADH) large chain/glutamate synthase (ferredoxin)
LDITYPASWGHEGVEAKLASLCAASCGRHQRRQQHFDHQRPQRVAPRKWPFPRCWRCRPFTSTLVREGLRTTAGLVVETGTAREVHHFAVLAGYGAEAVHPYLAMETLQALHKELPGDLSADKAIYNYIKAIGKGLSKIMSKMGVSHLHVVTAARSCSKPLASTPKP